MRTFRIITISILASLTMVISACDPDEDDPFGDEVRDKYIGTWRVQENNKKKITYNVQIAADPGNSSQVLISNFYNYGIEPYAIVTTGTITLPTQSFAKGIVIYGTGSYTTGKINWTYYVNDGADLDTIQSVYTKL